MHKAYEKSEIVEEYLKNANCYGKYNYYFICYVDSEISLLLGLIGALLNIRQNKISQNKKVVGCILNQTDIGIYLIPIIPATLTPDKPDQINKQFIKQEDIAKITIKKENYYNRKIIISLNNNQKIILRTKKRIKHTAYHKENLNKFIKLYS